MKRVSALSLALVAILGAPLPAAADCPPPSILWMVPDRPSAPVGTNATFLVAIVDTAPGGFVRGTLTVDETFDELAVTWEELPVDRGHAEGGSSAVYRAVFKGTPDAELTVLTRYNLSYEYVPAGGGLVGPFDQAIATGDGPDTIGPALSGSFDVLVTEVDAGSSCAFGADELLFEFQATKLEADGGAANALHITLFSVFAPDSDIPVMYDTGYYAGTTWSAVAARYSDRVDVCFGLEATDIYGNRSNYDPQDCVVLPGAPPPDDDDGGDDPHLDSGCGCRAAGTASGAVPASLFLAVVVGRAKLRRRR